MAVAARGMDGRRMHINAQDGWMMDAYKYSRGWVAADE
jgi:hypothetical protein